MIANAAGLTGLVLTVILWATQRRRSRFVRAHIVQALVYQAGTLLGVVLLMLLWSGCLLLSLLPAALRPDLYRDGTLPDTFWVALFGLILPIGYGVAATLYALYGAYQVYRGARFAYPLAGRLVARDLEESQSGASASATPPSERQTGTPASAPSLPGATPAPSLPASGSPVAMQPLAQNESPAPRAAPTPPFPSPASPVAVQPLAQNEHPEAAPPAALQTRALGEEGAPAPSAPSSGATAISAPPSVPETAPAVTGDEAASSSSGATPVPPVSSVTDVTPVQDALDQGSRPADRAIASSADAASTGQPPEER